MQPIAKQKCSAFCTYSVDLSLGLPLFPSSLRDDVK